MSNDIPQMTAQIRKLIDPNRRGGVSASELGKAIAILNSIDVTAREQQDTLSKVYLLAGKHLPAPTA